MKLNIYRLSRQQKILSFVQELVVDLIGINFMYVASNVEVPYQVIEEISRVAKLVASSASEVGVPYSSKQMMNIYSASGTFADWSVFTS